ncbi:MAG: type IX secretion system membrane protein PorP/SprF [Elusimicrobiota bacterium]
MMNLLLLLILGCRPALAGFEDLGAGARPMGMGNAFTALADDVSAVHFNPAGLARLSRPELSAGYSRLYMGLSDGSDIGHGFLAYAHPLGARSALAAGMLDLKLSNAFEERTCIFSYARRVRPSLSLGASLKLLERRYELGGDPHLANDPVFSGGTSARGLGLDLAALYRSSGPFSAGLSIAELNQPDLGLKSEDKVPRTVRFGAAYRPPGYTFDGDLVLRDGDWDVLLGMERIFARSLVGRMGFGLGSRSDRDVSAGAGLRAAHFQLDYAFVFPLSGVAATAGTHRFTMTVRFGASPPAWDSGPRPKEAASAMAPVLEDRIKTMGEELERARKGQEETAEILKRLEQRLSSPAKPEAKRAVVSQPPSRPKIHVVSEGDTLQSIAQKLYGDAGKWTDIYRVNQDQIGPGGRLNKGLRLAIP